MSLSTTELEQLVSSLITLQDEKQIQRSIELICIEMKCYIECITISRMEKLKCLFLHLLKEGYSSFFFDIYTRFRLISAVLNEPSEVSLATNNHLPYQLLVADVVLRVMSHPDQIIDATHSLEYLISNQNMSIHELLHAIIQVSSAIDRFIDEDSSIRNLLPPVYKRHRLFEFVQLNHPMKFNSYLKLSFLSIFNAAAVNIKSTPSKECTLVILPQILKEYIIVTSFSKISTNALVSSFCEILALHEGSSHGKVLTKLLSYIDQLAPPNVCVEIIAKHIICSNSKAHIRRIAILNIIGRLQDICNEYDSLGNLHCDENEGIKKPFSRLFCGIEAWVFTSITTARVTSLKDHTQVLLKAYIMISTTVLDSIMLDPAEANRWGAMTNFIPAFEDTKSRAVEMLGKKTIIPIQEQCFQVLLMKCNDKSARIRTKSVSFLLTKEAFIKAPSSYATLIGQDNLLSGIRQLLRTSLQSMNDESYRQVVHELVSVSLNHYIMNEITKRNTATTYAEDLQEAIELLLARLKIPHLSKCGSIDINRVNFIVGVLRECYIRNINSK